MGRHGRLEAPDLAMLGLMALLMDGAMPLLIIIPLFMNSAMSVEGSVLLPSK